MYLIEGKMTVRHDLDSLPGKFGVYSASRFPGLPEIQQSVWVHESERWAKGHAWLLRHLLKDTSASYEPITDDNVQTYAGDMAGTVYRDSLRRPDLARTVEAALPAGAALVGATAKLWKEVRIPTPVAYVGAYGRLQEAQTYDPQEGWHDTYDEVNSAQVRLGVMAPPTVRAALSATLWDRSINYAEVLDRMAAWGITLPGDPKS